MYIQRITLAVEDMDSMVEFYNAIFECGLEPIEGSPLTKGRFADLELVVCPNSVAGVIAEQNRHQFRLVVEDADALATRIEAAGGSVVNRDARGGKALVGVADPEGNTYELVNP
jgi:predicted enzyme related to lactoylglutathione lyase